jgi:hypothetical protein
MWTPAGQSVPYLREVRTVDEIMAQLVDETEQALARIAAYKKS